MVCCKGGNSECTHANGSLCACKAKPAGQCDCQRAESAQGAESGLCPCGKNSKDQCDCSAHSNRETDFTNA